MQNDPAALFVLDRIHGGHILVNDAMILFTTGTMTIDYQDEDVVIDFELYTADSVRYHGMYQGPAQYR